MSMPASPELSASVKRISAVPPPKMVWNASEKFVLMACEGLLKFFLGDDVQLRDGLLRVRDGLQQVVALARQEGEALLAFVEFLQRHHVHRAHGLDALFHFAIAGFGGRQFFAAHERSFRGDQVLGLRVHFRHAGLAQMLAVGIVAGLLDFARGCVGRASPAAIWRAHAQMIFHLASRASVPCPIPVRVPSAVTSRRAFSARRPSSCCVSSCRLARHAMVSSLMELAAAAAPLRGAADPRFSSCKRCGRSLPPRPAVRSWPPVPRVRRPVRSARIRYEPRSCATSSGQSRALRFGFRADGSRRGVLLLCAFRARSAPAPLPCARGSARSGKPSAPAPGAPSSPCICSCRCFAANTLRSASRCWPVNSSSACSALRSSAATALQTRLRSSAALLPVASLPHPARAVRASSPAGRLHPRVPPVTMRPW